jgi:hypothetical protein
VRKNNWPAHYGCTFKESVDTGERRTLSSSGLLGIALGLPPFIVAIEIATLLDVLRVSGNDRVGHAQKSFGNDSSDRGETSDGLT